MTSPSVTIVVAPRERFSYALRSLESIYGNTDYPFELVYVDGNSPPRVREQLRAEASRRGFRLIHSDRYLSPNQARNLAIPHLTSKYVAFLDNDVEVSPGWLTHLVACAESTGAWAVAPVYFQGAMRERIVHLAGGIAEFSESDGVRTFYEEHVLNGESFDDVAPSLKQGPTGFFEFHGVLLLTEVFRQFGPLDEEYLSLHEHMDLSLRIKKAGGEVYLEPKAQIAYVHGLLWDSDLEYVRLRWGHDWNHRSTVHFANAWGVGEDSEWAQSSTHWGDNHCEHLERMRRSPVAGTKRVMERVLPSNVISALRAVRR